MDSPFYFLFFFSKISLYVYIMGENLVLWEVKAKKSPAGVPSECLSVSNDVCTYLPKDTSIDSTISSEAQNVRVGRDPLT